MSLVAEYEPTGCVFVDTGNLAYRTVLDEGDGELTDAVLRRAVKAAKKAQVSFAGDGVSPCRCGGHGW